MISNHHNNNLDIWYLPNESWYHNISKTIKDCTSVMLSLSGLDYYLLLIFRNEPGHLGTWVIFVIGPNSYLSRTESWKLISVALPPLLFVTPKECD